jgi:hypothetical protein
MMQRYRVEFTSPTTFYAVVDAESESAARQAFIDSDVNWVELGDDVPDDLAEFTSVTLVGVEEVE